MGVTLAALFLPQSIVGLNIFDEGFIVSGAMLVNDGRLPYRDFLSMYGPGQYYLTAAIYRLFGEELVYVRVLHIILLTSLGFAVYLLSKRISHSRLASLIALFYYAAIVIYAEPHVGYPAITATLFLVASAFALTTWSESMHPRSLAIASLTIGIAGLFRWDFGIFGLLALLIAIVLHQSLERNISNRLIQLFQNINYALVPAVIIMTVVYVFLILIKSDPVQWYKEVPLFSLTEFAKWRGIDYVKPQYWSFFRENTPTTFIVPILNLTYLAVPVSLVLGASVVTLQYMFRPLATSDRKMRFVLTVFFSFLCLFLLNQMRVRPGLIQGFPAIVVSIPIAVLVTTYIGNSTVFGKPVKVFFLISGLLAVALIAIVKHEKWLLLVKEDSIVVDDPRYSGIHLDLKDRSYIDLVRYIHGNTKPNEAIFSGVTDHSRLFINDTVIYFLTGRPPADRYLELEPGISNTVHGQQTIVNSLLQKNVRLIVLVDIVGYEPNQTSKSNGVYILNDFISQNYHLDRTFKTYGVYLKNSEQ